MNIEVGDRYLDREVVAVDGSTVSLRCACGTVSDVTRSSIGKRSVIGRQCPICRTADANAKADARWLTRGYGRYPERSRPLRPHGFIVGNFVGEREIERVTTTRVILKCKCGAINCVTIRRLEAEQPKTCRACATKVKPGTRGAIASMHVGQRFGTRTIRGFLVRPASEGGTVVELDCDCGTPGVAFPRKLAAGLDQSCPRCADRRRTPLRDRAC